jgi:hypothetical protein
MSPKSPKVGDVFEIPLSDGRKAYGQYMFQDKKVGPLIQVFDLITEGDAQSNQVLSQLKDAGFLFPPVVTGLFAAIRTSLWKIIGHMPVTKFAYPKFVSTMHEGYQQRGLWFLWDGKTWVELGHELAEEYKESEFLVVWDPHDIAHRIETGENPYAKLISGQ